MPLITKDLITVQHSDVQKVSYFNIKVNKGYKEKNAAWNKFFPTE